MRFLKNFDILKNSLFISLGRILNSLLSTVFWIFVANLINPNLVGIAVGIISVETIIALISRLGLETSLIRFPFDLSEKNFMLVKEGIIFSNSMVIILSILYIFLMNSQNFFTNSSWQLILLILLSFIGLPITFLNFGFLDAILISLKNPELIVLKNTTAGLVKILTVLIISFTLTFIPGEHTIIISWVFGNCTALIITTIIISYKNINSNSFMENPKSINTSILKSREEFWHFSLSNYFINLFAAVPGYIFPILALSYFGNEFAAYLYTTWMFASIVLTIAVSVHHSFLAETSRGDEEQKTLLIAFGFSSLIVFVSICGTILFGNNLLGLYGTSYITGGSMILIYFMIANIPCSLNSFILTLARKRKEMKILSFSYTLILIMSGVIFLVLNESLGFNSIGLSWLIANVLGFVLLLIWIINTRIKSIFSSIIDVKT